MPTDALEQFAGLFTGGTSIVFAAAFGIAAQILQKVGMPLFGILAGLSLILTAIRIPLEKDTPHEVIGELVERILEIGFFLFLLTEYQWIIGGGVKPLFDQIASIVNGDGALAGFKNIVTIGVAILGGVSKLFEGLGIVGAILALLQNLIAIILMVVSGLLTLFAAAVYVVIFFVADVLVAIAIALGPFFIALGVLHYTRSNFESWFNFLVNGFMYKVVGGTMVTLIGGMTQKVMAIIVGRPDDWTGSTSAAIAALLFSIAIIYLMRSVPDIASGLMRGVTAAGRNEAGAPQKVTTKFITKKIAQWREKAGGES